MNIESENGPHFQKGGFPAWEEKKKAPAVFCQLESRAKFAQNPMVEALPDSTWN